MASFGQINLRCYTGKRDFKRLRSEDEADELREIINQHHERWTKTSKLQQAALADES